MHWELQKCSMTSDDPCLNMTITAMKFMQFMYIIMVAMRPC